MARNGINGLNQNQLNRSFNSLKLYFVIMSVILIVVFVVILLVAIGFAMKAV
jgi:CHASE3 domain sensor protein